MTTKLATFMYGRKVWTIDPRLKEFRRVHYRHGQPWMETVPFNTPKGDEMLASAIRRGKISMKVTLTRLDL